MRRRIVDMGITPGTRITIIKTAPMGDPIEITLRGYSLSLRREDALQITLMDEDEAQTLRHKQQEALKAHEQRSRSQLGHASDTDQASHERAARLTVSFTSGHGEGYADLLGANQARANG